MTVIPTDRNAVQGVEEPAVALNLSTSMKGRHNTINLAIPVTNPAAASSNKGVSIQQ